MTRYSLGRLGTWVLWQQTGARRGECEGSRQRRLDTWRRADSGYEVEGHTVTVRLEGMEAAIRRLRLPRDVDPRR